VLRYRHTLLYFYGQAFRIAYLYSFKPSIAISALLTLAEGSFGRMSNFNAFINFENIIPLLNKK